MTITDNMQAAILKVPASVWTPAYDDARLLGRCLGRGLHRGLVDTGGWPVGMGVIAGRSARIPEQLRFTHIDEYRFTAFATDARIYQLEDLKPRPNRFNCACSPSPGALARGGRRLELRLVEHWPLVTGVTPRYPLQAIRLG